jgi:predicted transcriptional regulator
MNIERPIFEEEDEEAEAASIARAEADIAAGRTVPHSEVAKWLKTWGTPEAGPPPAEWFKRK